MPAYQLHEMLTRIGLALGAGVLIAITPIAYRRTRFEPSRIKRVIYYMVSLAALVGFGFYVRFLWNTFVPHEPETPAAITYPAAPGAPVSPVRPVAR